MADGVVSTPTGRGKSEMAFRGIFKGVPSTRPLTNAKSLFQATEVLIATENVDRQGVTVIVEVLLGVPVPFLFISV